MQQLEDLFDFLVEHRLEAEHEIDHREVVFECFHEVLIGRRHLDGWRRQLLDLLVREEIGSLAEGQFFTVHRRATSDHWG